jgi:hemerythrin-like metal-binding protein
VLLELLNRSRLAAASGDETKSITLLKQVQEFTLLHFRREEAVMKACGYPGLDNHRQVHQLLIRQLEKMQRELKQQKLSVNDLATFLGNWWGDHIQNMDRAFASQCQDKAELITQALEQAGLASQWERKE